jgi:hypothetical protein
VHALDTAMKTERVTILAAPAFKSWLAAEAQREGVSVGELVRQRCEQPAPRTTPDEARLAQEVAALAAELKTAVAQARRSLRDGLAQAESTLSALAGARAATAGPGKALVVREPSPMARTARPPLQKSTRKAAR